MAVSAAAIDAAPDVFSGLRPRTTRMMMGGLCIDWQGNILGLLSSDGAIPLKGRGEMATRMEAGG